MVTNSLPYELIIGSPTLVDMCARINLYHQTVKVRKHRKTETLNLVNGPEMYQETEDELTRATESNIGEESDREEYSAFVTTFSEKEKFIRRRKRKRPG